MRAPTLLAILLVVVLPGCALRPGESTLAPGDARIDARIPEGVNAIQIRVDARRVSVETGSLDIVVLDEAGNVVAQQGFDVTDATSRALNVDATHRARLVVETRTTSGVLAYDVFVTSQPMPGSAGFKLGEAHVSPAGASALDAANGTLP